MKAVQIKSHGDPIDVLEVVDLPEPKAPGVDEALIGIELAALTKYDLLSISKALGEGPAFPTIVGTEGFGRVLERIDVGWIYLTSTPLVSPPLQSSLPNPP
jgi:NADPH:quinone reductase-like Zn-dependent oxidoreductase